MPDKALSIEREAKCPDLNHPLPRLIYGTPNKTQEGRGAVFGGRPTLLAFPDSAGEVILSKNLPNGNKTTVSVRVAGDMIGEVAVFDGKPYDTNAVALMEVSARLAILRLLKKWGEGTATQLSKALGISRVAAHQHLDWLEEKKLVQVKVEKKSRGRPAKVFSLTELAQEQFFPRRCDLLALTALDELASELGDKFLLRIFRRYREKSMEKLSGLISGLRSNLRERVQTLTELLSDEGYLAYFEETEDYFILYLTNCPIAQIAPRFREARLSEEEALTKILGVPVSPECRQANGSAYCRYSIKKDVVKEKACAEQCFEA